jgi:hypothetical protein
MQGTVPAPRAKLHAYGRGLSTLSQNWDSTVPQVPSKSQPQCGTAEPKVKSTTVPVVSTGS